MQLILMAVTDILILFLLVYILIRLTRKESKTELTEIRALKDSFEKLMSESHFFLIFLFNFHRSVSCRDVRVPILI